MSDQTLWMLLPLTIAEGKTEEWERFFAEMRAMVARDEPETLCFDMYRVAGRPNRYMVIECYANQAAWEAHSRLQGERGIVPRMVEFQAAPPDFQFLEPVAGPLR